MTWVTRCLLANGNEDPFFTGTAAVSAETCFRPFECHLTKLGVALRSEKNQQFASGDFWTISRSLGPRHTFDLRSTGPQLRSDCEINGLRFNGVFGGYSDSL